MKRCMVQGAMLADSTSEQSPTVTLCKARSAFARTSSQGQTGKLL